MTSSVERFWNSIGHWRKDHVRVEVSFARLSGKYEVWTLEGIVASERGTLVTFRADNGEEKSIDFGSAVDVRLASFEPLDATVSFRAMWSDGAECTLIELRVFGKPI